MPNNNDVNNLILEPQGVYLPGLKFPSAFVSGAGSGNIDMYTCPTGKRAIVTYIIAYNTAGTSTTIFPNLNVSGTYYRIGGAGSVAAGGNGQVLNLSAPTSSVIILEAGEKIGVNTTQAGCNLFANIMEFDNTAPLKTSKVVSMGNGNNTIYTCPAGKKAVILDQWVALNLSLKKLYYFNNSGSSNSIVWYAVPNGGSTGATNQLQTETVSNATLSVRQGGGWMLNAGDFLVCNTPTGTATQTGWVNVWEL